MAAANSRKTGRRKIPVGRRWVKGQSGNPNGRPKIPDDWRKAFRDGLPEALEKLRAGVASGERWAVELWLAYALGKPTQPLVHTGEDGGPIRVSADEVRAHILGRLAKASA